jgi:hypothetical protein
MPLALALALLAPIAVAGGVAPSAAEDRPAVIDAAIASMQGALVTLSDVALARALGLFGLERNDGPIAPDEVTRYVNAQLAVREAGQLAVRVSPADVARAWEAVDGAALTARLGPPGSIRPGAAADRGGPPAPALRRAAVPGVRS